MFKHTHFFEKVHFKYIILHRKIKKSLNHVTLLLSHFKLCKHGLCIHICTLILAYERKTYKWRVTFIYRKTVVFSKYIEFSKVWLDLGSFKSFN